MYITIEGLNSLMVMITLYKHVLKGNMYMVHVIRNLLTKLKIVGVYSIHLYRNWGSVLSELINGNHDPLIQTCIKRYYLHVIRNLYIDKV